MKKATVKKKSGAKKAKGMKHDILGTIKRAGEDGVATIRYGSRDIEVQVIPDDQEFETTLRLAADVVQRLSALDKAAKRVAVADLLKTYNDGWNEYDEVQADGSLKTVVNPKLSKAQFEKNLSLNAINATGDKMVQFFYDDEKMFWGHSVIVSSLKGTDFSEAYAELFG
jgi:hypothetical protein